MDGNKYTEHAADYERYRKSYPQSLYTYLDNEFSISRDSVLADIGAGTGKLCREYIERGNEVYCVEPNEGMRAVSKELFGTYAKFHSLDGAAEVTGLTDHSIDCVMVGTAFHWFDENKFRAECRRILKASGKVILVWISRPVNLVTDGSGHEKFQINFNGISGGKEENPEAFHQFFVPDTMNYKILKESVWYQKEAFVERVISTFHHMDDQQHRNEIAELFDLNSEDGRLEIPIYVRCISGEV